MKCSVIYLIFTAKLSVADLRGARGTPLPGVQILSISCIFWENLAKSYVGAPLPRGIGAPSSRKSWIRHCNLLESNYLIRVCNKTLPVDMRKLQHPETPLASTRYKQIFIFQVLNPCEVLKIYHLHCNDTFRQHRSRLNSKCRSERFIYVDVLLAIVVKHGFPIRE